MSRTRKAAATAMFSYGRFAMAIVPGLVLVPLTIASLGARTYGLWLTVGELLTYAAMVDPGIVGAMPWLIAESEGAAGRRAMRRLASNGLAAGCVAGAGLIAVAAGVWTVLPDTLAWTSDDRAQLGPPLIFLVLVTGVTYPFRTFNAVLVGLQDVAWVGSIAIAEIAIDVVLLAILLLAGYNVWALAWAAAASSIFMAAACVIRVAFLAPDIFTEWESPSVAGLGLLLRSGVGVWLAGFGWQLIASSNNIVITFLRHPEWVPLFVCTSKAASVLLQLGWIVPDSGLVGLAQLNGERPRSDRVKDMVGALILLHLLIAGVAVCGVLAFNPTFVRHWVGDAFFGGLRLNALFAAMVLMFTLAHAVITAAAVVGDRLRVGAVTILTGAVQIAGAIVLGRLWGVQGVAAAGILAGIVTAVPLGLVLLQSAGAVSMRRLLSLILGRWASRALPLMGAAALVGIFRDALGPWGTAIATMTIAAWYIWHMRPFYALLPLDPRWVRWLVSLRLMPPATATSAP